MRIQFGSMLLGALLVTGGFALAQVPSWLRPVQADVAFDAPSNTLITSGEGSSAVYVWRIKPDGSVRATFHGLLGEGQSFGASRLVTREFAGEPEPKPK